ncbi:hypothetical protein BD408DRAFT_414110, partial [Parasitella parasitica]
LNQNILVTQPNIQADEPEVFQENMRDLATDLKYSGIQQSEEELINLLKSLEEENRTTSEEYEEALKKMGILSNGKKQINQSLRVIADEQSQSIIKD